MKSLLSFLFILVITTPILAQEYAKINPENIRIARDKWGVPHIFGKTDAEAAYGLAWANAEDAFDKIQELLFISKQIMGRKNGVDGAAFDFFAHSINADRTYEACKKNLSPEYLKYVDGYCQGINAYAAKYPKKVLVKKAFPITKEEVIKTYIIAFSALSGMADQVENIMKGKYDQKRPNDHAGSNAYAFAPSKTTNRNTYLCVNPHFRITGGFSFYEAHLHSEEGLNITGTLFQGGTSIFMGNNEHLGWAKTYNHVDNVDVFELEMHPKKKLYYKLDGEYVKLEKRPVWLKVRLGKSFVLPVKKMTYWSKFGPTYKSPDKRFFSIRAASLWGGNAGQQYYEMNKATNYQSFRKAINKNQIAMFNMVYADKDGTIYYISNSILPKRHPKYNYHEILTGNTSDHLWTEFYHPDDLPHVLNPYCGYVFNTNNSVLNASCKKTNSDSLVLYYANNRNGENNRSIRFKQLFEEDKKYDWETFKKVKFDTKISKDWIYWKAMKGLWDIDPSQYPPLEEAIKLAQSWNGDASPKNDTASIFFLAFQHIFIKQGYTDAVFTIGIKDTIPESLFIEAIEEASKTLLQQHGALKVPLGKVLFHKRNGKYLPASGFPDALSPIYPEPDEEGKQVAIYGDTYIHFVQFDKDGPTKIETLLPFKDTPTCENYEDELKMFNKRELKTMSLDKAYNLKNAVKTYHPK